MNRAHRAYMQKYHGSQRFSEASYLNREAPVLDAYIGLLEAPGYVLYLGLRDNAEDELKKAGCWMSMSHRQFHREGLDAKYHRRVEVIDHAQ